MSPRLDVTDETLSPQSIGLPSARPSGLFVQRKVSLRTYAQCFAGGMASAALLMWCLQPTVIPKTNILASPHPHLTPVYYRVFILDHPFHSPFHASLDDTTLGRFFPVDLAPPFTGQKVTNYLVKRENLNPSLPASLFANLTSIDPVPPDELVVLLRGNEPIGDPNQPLMLVLSGGTTTSNWKHAVLQYLDRVFNAIADSPFVTLFVFFLCLIVCFPGLVLRYWRAHRLDDTAGIDTHSLT